MPVHQPPPQSSVSQSRPPRVVVPSTRVNIAFPLSKLVIAQPDEAVRELADLVAQLAVVLERMQPDDELTALRASAQALAARLA